MSNTGTQDQNKIRIGLEMQHLLNFDLIDVVYSVNTVKCNVKKILKKDCVNGMFLL